VANSKNTEEQEINCELENPDREALNILMLVNIYLSRTVNAQKNHRKVENNQPGRALRNA
jgi:hypothetical protein